MHTIKCNVIMDTTITKSSVSIRIDSVLLKQLREEAQNENRSLSNYLETILYRVYHKASGGDNSTIAPSLELKAKIDRAREDYRNGQGTTCKTVDDSVALFESL